jgi:glycosyltransferase involved in cell wall biosynthesis
MHIQERRQQNPSKIRYFNLKTWIDTLSAKKVLLVSNRDLTMKPFLYGEDYYMHTLAMELEKRKIQVDYLIVPKHNFCKLSIDINKIDNKELVILQHASPFWLFKAIIKKKIRVVKAVYLAKQKVSLSTKLRRKLRYLLWQPIIDEYLVPSLILADTLRKLGVVRRISVIPPEYTCIHCSYSENLRKKVDLTKRLPVTVEAVYIGTLTQKRFPLTQILETLNRDCQRTYNLKIYTTSHVKAETYQKGNVEITIIRKKLSDEEKCKILRKSHIFVAPAKNSTIEPPISVIEAEYHGNIIIRNW